MPTTFSDVWRLVRLHVPDAPMMLVRDWVQSTYARLTDFRPWTWTLEPGQMVWQDARTLTDVSVTLGSTQVTSVAGVFLSGDAGRQFRVGTFPIYTVARFVNSNTIDLDQPFQGTETGTVDAQIVDAWATLPENFGAFMAVIDQTNQRWIPWWMTTDELGLLDPTRQSSGTPTVLTAMGLSQYTPTLGRPLYAYWPIPTEAGSLQYYMRTRPAALADATLFKGVLGTRGDVLQTGALAQAAKWPGTRERPNPYFNLALARQLDAEFLQLMCQLDLRDDDVNPLSLDKVPWQRWTAWTWAYNTNYLQMTDATIGEYWGMNWYPGGW